MAKSDKGFTSLACPGDEVRLVRELELLVGGTLPQGLRGRVVTLGAFTMEVDFGGRRVMLGPSYVVLAPTGKADQRRASRVASGEHAVSVPSAVLAELAQISGDEGTLVLREALGLGTMTGLERIVRRGESAI